MRGYFLGGRAARENQYYFDLLPISWGSAPEKQQHSPTDPASYAGYTLYKTFFASWKYKLHESNDPLKIGNPETNNKIM